MLVKHNELKVEVYSPHTNMMGLQNLSHGVKITHIPTGICVNSHKFNSQIRNKEESLKLLESELERRRIR